MDEVENVPAKKSDSIPEVSLEDLVNKVDYNFLVTKYVPSKFALKFITFIKLVNGKGGEENKSPLIHLDMLDQVKNFDENLFVAFRGSAKTTLIHEYMYLYIAVYGEIEDFGEINVAIYVSDTIDNGVKSMRQNLQFRWNNSDFLQKYIPEVRFTDVRWEFTNISGKKFCVRGFGASTGVRGFKEYGQRPTLCGFDDLMSDKNAESPTITRDIRNIIYKAARQALHPKKRKILWTGTPFNKKDPLYEAASSKSWNVRVYPIAEKYPCTKQDFIGAWEDRFSYEFVKNEYNKLLGNNQIAAFNQELMLRIISEEDRLVQDSDIQYFSRQSLLKNMNDYNFYITTDFATSEKTSSDYSVISVWAYNHNGDWFYVDGIVKRQLMDQNIKDLFKYVSVYSPQEVGIEVTGQQGGFIQWIQSEMISKNIFFNLTSQGNSGNPGVRPNTNKMVRFMTVLPLIKAHKVYFPTELEGTFEMREARDELFNASRSGFKSKHDDFIDTMSMLTLLLTWKPNIGSSNPTTSISNGIKELAGGTDTDLTLDDYDDYDIMSSYDID